MQTCVNVLLLLSILIVCTHTTMSSQFLVHLLCPIPGKGTGMQHPLTLTLTGTHPKRDTSDGQKSTTQEQHEEEASDSWMVPASKVSQAYSVFMLKVRLGACMYVLFCAAS